MRKFKPREKKTFVRKNEYIRVPEVRLVDSDGAMLGIKPIQEALDLAKERQLELVEISPTAKPPVCKILDYSKYLYEQNKKKKETKKKQKANVLKEVRLKSRIASHDLETKIRHAEEFLRKEEKVKITVVFFGRENKHKDLGRDMLTKIKERLSSVSTSEDRIQALGNRISLTFSPKKTQ